MPRTGESGALKRFDYPFEIQEPRACEVTGCRYHCAFQFPLRAQL